MALKDCHCLKEGVRGSGGFLYTENELHIILQHYVNLDKAKAKHEHANRFNTSKATLDRKAIAAGIMEKPEPRIYSEMKTKSAPKIKTTIEAIAELEKKRAAFQAQIDELNINIADLKELDDEKWRVLSSI